jgi:hypothetical protein
MKNMTIEQQKQREKDNDPMTKWLAIIIIIGCSILLIKNIWFRDF